MRLVAGIDLGSTQAKAVLIDEASRVVGTASVRIDGNPADVARRALDLALTAAQATEQDVVYCASTGVGRYEVPFRDLPITETTCFGRGAAFLFPSTRCVLEIGARGLRAIRIRPLGKVEGCKDDRIVPEDDLGADGDVSGRMYGFLVMRSLALLTALGLEPQLTLVGGLAREAGLVRSMRALAKVPVNVPNEPEVAGALGAALLGAERSRR